jgi:hypothetical protein
VVAGFVGLELSPPPPPQETRRNKVLSPTIRTKEILFLFFMVFSLGVKVMN